MSLSRDLVVAFMFLSRLPVRISGTWQRDDLASSAVMFPLVGAVIGSIGALAYGLSTALALPPLLAAVIGLSAVVLATGALHEDGLADVADGFGGGRTKADKLEIMRDSRLGSYGTIALVLTLITRIGCLAALALPWTVATGLIVTGAISRAALPIAMVISNQAREDGLAARAGRPHPGRAAAAGMIAALLACLCLPWDQAIILIAAAAIVAALVLTLANRQIGGITGDVLGALQQAVEIGTLLALVALTGRP